MIRVICAWCSDVMRVDADDLDLVLAASGHMEVLVSHGICRDCADKVLEQQPEVASTVWGDFVVGDMTQCR